MQQGGVSKIRSDQIQLRGEWGEAGSAGGECERERRGREGIARAGGGRCGWEREREEAPPAAWVREWRAWEAGGASREVGGAGGEREREEKDRHNTVYNYTNKLIAELIHKSFHLFVLFNRAN